jgi:opacity protein-like surface antigen
MFYRYILKICAVHFMFLFQKEIRMKNSILALISVMLFVFASSALADNYVTGKIGVYFPTESAFDNGFNIEVAYGIDIADITGVDNLALEVGLGYYEASFDESWVFFGQTFRSDFDLSVIPVTATAVYTHEINDRLSLFGGGGLGLYRAKLEVAMTDFDPFTGTTQTVSGDTTTTRLGLQLVGGGLYHLNDQVGLSAELKYVGAGSVSGADIGGMFLNAGIRYRF